MYRLKKLIDERLIKETDREKQIRILQEINTMLLTGYVVRVRDTIIEPLWIEIYYFNEKNFPDYNSHMSCKQKGRFGQLYFHEKGRGGLDICLSDDDSYYLSVLLKSTLIYKQGNSEKKFKTQTEIYDVLRETNLSIHEIEDLRDVLERKDNQDVIVATVRRNLQKPCFKDALLAACPSRAVIGDYKIVFPDKYKKQWKCSVRALLEEKDEGKARDKANEYNGSKVEEKYWKLAKDSLALNEPMN